MGVVRRIGATFLTFNLVAFGWLLFTAEDMAQVRDMLGRIAYNFSFAEFVPMVEESKVAMIMMAVGYLMHFLPKSLNSYAVRGISRLGFVGEWLIVVVAIWLVMQCDALLMLHIGVGGGLPMYANF